MKRKVGILSAVLVFILGLAVWCPAQTKTLTILHTNDTHSALLPFTHQPCPTPLTWFLMDSRLSWPDELRGPCGFNRDYAGIARMATLIHRIRGAKKNVLALNAGDVFVGSFEFNQYLGYPELKIMEGLYDAMALGNHEFDLGLGVLAGVVTGAFAQSDPVELPLLCANFAFVNPADPNDPTNVLAGIVKESIIRTIDGVKIGIFGLGNEDPVNYSAEVAARFSGHPLEVAAAQVASLRGSGCQVIICVSHQGTSFDVDELSAVDGIDIIVGGHSHELFRKAVVRNGTIIVQAGSHGRYLGELQVKVGAGGVKLLSWRIHEVDAAVKPDPSIQAQLRPLREGVVARFGPVYSETVATAFRTIGHDWPAAGPYRDTPLGNLVTDAMTAAAKKAGFAADCALDALGYTEFGIPAGKVVGNDILRAVPYGYDPATGLGFKLVVVPMPGLLIIGGLDYAVSQKSSALSIQASGLTYAYHSGAGHVIPESILINGQPLVADNLYDVVMSEGVFSFLEALAKAQGFPLTAIPTEISEYTAVRDFMKSLGFVNYKSEGRVIDAAAAEPAVKRK